MRGVGVGSGNRLPLLCVCGCGGGGGEGERRRGQRECVIADAVSLNDRMITVDLQVQHCAVVRPGDQRQR
jgi:hypothetical protein